MTTKQIILSALICSAMSTIVLGMENSNTAITKENKMHRAQELMHMEDRKTLERRLTKLRLNSTCNMARIKESLGIEKNDDDNTYSSLSPEQYQEMIHGGWEKCFPKWPLKEFKLSYTTHEQNKNYGYPQLPSQLSDFSHMNVQQYEEEYQKAIDRELNATITQQDLDTGASWPFYHANNLETALLCNLHTIKQQQEVNAILEETLFEANVGKLNQPIAEFVMDFKTWPKEEQNKIQTYRLKYSKNYYIINGKLAASDKYNAQYGLNVYLDHHLTEQQLTPFLDAIDYLKKQQ